MKRFFQLKSRAVVAVVAAAMFVVQLDAAVLAIALPDIARDFARPTVSLSLAITVYLTLLIALLPVSGWAAERFGARRVFVAATAGFALCSLACALAPSFWWFILARGLQGAAASLMTPVARLIMLRRTSKAEMVDALSITAMPMLIAPTLGPSIGGLIVDVASWHYIFLLNLPVALLLIGVTLWKVPQMAPESRPALDWRGALLLGGSLVALLTGADRLASAAGQPLPWLLLAAGAGGGWLTLRHLRRFPEPVVRLEAMAIPAFRVTAIGAGAMIRIPQRAALFLLPLMFQLGMGFSAFAAGLLLMAINGGDLVSKPFVRPWIERHGFGRAVTVASLAGLAGLVLVAVAGEGPLWLAAILAGLVVAGVSRSLVFTGVASLGFVSLSEREMTSGNVLATISLQLFNALAISLAALVLGLAVQWRGGGEPALGDFRLALLATVLIGLWATLALRPQLPRDLAEVHPEEG